tara:strand:+ start:1059 stop:1829 length:771 start_codon:yes stop_codon:yes gene_type:complete
MLKFLRWVKIVFWAVAVAALLAPLVVISVWKNATVPAWEQIVQKDNVSGGTFDIPPLAIKKSRHSAVKVTSAGLSLFGGTSTATGTYFIAKNKHYVITVEHTIHGPCWLIVIFHEDEKYHCRTFVKVDVMNDYAIMEVEPITSRTPIRIPQDLPHGLQWKKSYSILNKIIYTGYPNIIGPLTLRGDVVGYTADEQLYIFSHAYGGSSGSGVFTHDGKYIGYVTAIDVGITEFGVDILENVVLVTPAFNVDWSIVLD